MDNLSKFNGIVSKFLRIDVNEIQNNLSPDNTINWDSLTHISIITAIESNFDISININDVEKMDSIGNMKEILNKYGIIL